MYACSLLQLAKGVFYASGICYLLYLLVLIVRACSELKNLPNFGSSLVRLQFVLCRRVKRLFCRATDVRLKFLTGLAGVVASTTVLLTWTKYGVLPALEDHFAAELTTHYASSVDLVLAYALFNLYLFLSAYVYSPAHSSATGSTHSITYNPWPFDRAEPLAPVLTLNREVNERRNG